MRNGVEQVKALRQVATEWNDQYAEARRKLITYKRKVAAFRQVHCVPVSFLFTYLSIYLPTYLSTYYVCTSTDGYTFVLQTLFERLKERNDPQISYIMRTIDDTIIEEFIDRFRGCSMSVDAIISNMGYTLPVSTANQCVGELVTVPVEEEEAVANFTRPGEANVFQFTASMHDNTDYEGYPEDPSILSLECSKSQLSDRTGGSTGSLPARYKQLDKHSNPDTGERRYSPRKQPGLSSFGAGRLDPQIVVNPRPVVSRGAGFRLANRKGDISDHDLQMASLSRSRTDGDLTGLALHGTGQGSPDSPDTGRIVHIMRSQMVAEGNLQSNQPERVLTEEELAELASHEKSFESIADSLSSKDRKPVKLPRGPRQLGKVMIGSRKPPKALKTTHPDMAGPPDMMAVPYKKTNFMNPTRARPLKVKAAEERIRKEEAGKATEEIRPLSSTNYGGLYVISSYKDEHPYHVGGTQSA